MATRITSAVRNAMCDAAVDRIDLDGVGTSVLQIRSGSQPASADDADSGTLLAEFTLPDPCFGAASSGVATANAITGVQGEAAGTAGHFRVKDGDGTTVMDGSVTASGGGGDLELNTTTISVGADVDVTSWTVTMPAG